MRDCGGNRSTVLLGAAASISKLRVDDRDRQPPGMIGLYRVGDLKQFLLGGLGRRERAYPNKVRGVWGKMVAGDRVGQDSRHQTIALPAIIELGAWRQSMIDAVANFERA